MHGPPFGPVHVVGGYELVEKTIRVMTVPSTILVLVLRVEARVNFPVAAAVVVVVVTMGRDLLAPLPLCTGRPGTPSCSQRSTRECGRGAPINVVRTHNDSGHSSAPCTF